MIRRILARIAYWLAPKCRSCGVPSTLPLCEACWMAHFRRDEQEALSWLDRQ